MLLCISLILFPISFLFEYMCLSLISGNKYKINILNIFIISILGVLNLLCAKESLLIIKATISIATYLVICLCLIKLNLKQSFICSSIYIIYIILFEFIISIILVFGLKYEPNNYIHSIYFQKAIVSLVITIFVYLLCLTKFTNNIYNKFLNLFNKIKLRFIHFYIFMFIVMLLSIFYIISIVSDLKIYNAIIYIAVVIFILLYIVSILYSYYYTKILNSFLEEKDENYQKLIDEYKIFKHNMKHKMILIKELGNKKVGKIIDNYLEELNDSIDNLNNISSLPKGLRGIIYNKIIESQYISKNIMIDNFCTTEPFENLSIKTYCALIESLGIVVDNALESVSNTDNYVYLYMTENNNYYEIKCSNKISDHINIDKLFTKDISTKKNHSGLGLYYIKNKSKLYSSININEDNFTITLRAKKKSHKM